MRGLPAGSYALLVVARPRLRAFVEVVDSDVEGVQLEPAPAIEVSGVVKSTGNSVALEGLSLRFESAEGPGMAAEFPLKADGTFTVNDILADVYRVAVAGPNPAHITSFRLGDKELTDGVFDLRNPPGAVVTVTVSAETVRVDGKVTGVDGQPLSGATVSLVPEQPGWDWQSRYQEMDADAEGRFAFAKVIPGHYRAFAWKDVPTGAPRDPGFRAPFEKRGSSIILEAYGRTLDLKAIDTERRQ